MSKRVLLSMLAALPLLAGAMAGAGEARAQGRSGGAEACDTGAVEWGAPALANAVSHYSLEWTPFGATEWGWETYLPLIQRELGTDCAPNSPAFARALAEFQYAHSL